MCPGLQSRHKERDNVSGGTSAIALWTSRHGNERRKFLREKKNNPLTGELRGVCSQKVKENKYGLRDVEQCVMGKGPQMERRKDTTEGVPE